MKITGVVGVLSIAAIFAGCSVNDGGTAIEFLRTDRRVDAENVGAKPVFSWKMQASRNGAAQKSWQIKVRELFGGQREIWNSGEVESGESVGVVYGGEALQPARAYEWELTVRDEKGRLTAPVKTSFKTAMFGADDWDGSRWISVETPSNTLQNATKKIACFRKSVKNSKALTNAYWSVTGLGVFEVYVNGKRVGNDLLKPGFTHVRKTRHSFTYDVTEMLKREAGASNELAAEVSIGWWGDRIVSFHGRNSAFRAQLILRYVDGSEERIGTDTTWLSAYAGSVTRTSIFDGEDFDARCDVSWRVTAAPANFAASVINREFRGEILPICGPTIVKRHDLTHKPQKMYVWRDIEGAGANAHGKVVVLRNCSDGEIVELEAGEKLVVDFGQNCAAMPELEVSGARGTAMKIRVAEMLNDGNGSKDRACDGPEGSLYCSNYRSARSQMNYIFAGEKEERYSPTFSFFGYRFIEISASAKISIKSVRSVPVTSLHREDDRGTLSTGIADLNQLISNVRWGQYSNYLSVPTDCPQRDERLGWSADTQVFTEAASCNADVYGFLGKWMGDMRDSQHPDGGYPGVAPYAQYGNEAHRFGWADAGVIVPYTMWKRSGETTIIRENWTSMRKFMAITTAYKYASLKASGNFQWSDWLSYELPEKVVKEFTDPSNGESGIKAMARYYWRYVGAYYWLWDAQMMAEMATAIGATAEAEGFAKIADEALAYIRVNFLKEDGSLAEFLPKMQTPLLFALKFGLFTSDEKKAEAVGLLLDNIADHNGCLQTGFLGTSIIMKTLSDEAGRLDAAYSLLLQDKNPSWLYSVHQGATTIWERWNSYTKEKGFGDVNMNSFNHYAYGSVLGWMYKVMAGIHENPAYGKGGFKHFLLAPRPDKRIGSVDCALDTEYGVVKSAWAYTADGTCKWKFTIPANTTATVRLPNGKSAEYKAGTYELDLAAK